MSPHRLLIVDDEPVIRSFLVRALENEGYEVHSARDGLEALDFLTSMSFDLLLTDIKMDRLNGVELLAEARQRIPGMAVILLTGHATVDSAIAALRQGANNYLLKPVKNEEIIAAVRDALEARKRKQQRDALEQIAQQMIVVVGHTADGEASRLVEQTLITCGDLAIDIPGFEARLSGTPLDLTPTEFRLLLTLASAPGVAFPFVQLVQAACGYTCSRQEAREIIGAHVLNLRGKLDIEPDQPLYVESVRGIGYRLIAP